MAQCANPPFEYVQRSMASMRIVRPISGYSHPNLKAAGDTTPSFVADLLGDQDALRKNMKHSPNMMQDIKYAVSTMYFGML